MKSLLLQMEKAVAAASLSQSGASLGSAFAAVLLLLLVLLGVCFLARKGGRLRKRKEAAGGIAEEHPLNSKVELPKGARAGSSQDCTVRNVNVLRECGAASRARGGRVKQVNREVKVHSNVPDGTEV